ncbi:hypothetical protein B484DRAFT_220653 [Ochromonadaceae sp. CCMP2298]|nr:hypothetical protein B484DRAFT_220653 [Ochromonadaceae sp. CCMP2298]
MLFGLSNSVYGRLSGDGGSQHPISGAAAAPVPEGDRDSAYGGEAVGCRRDEQHPTSVPIQRAPDLGGPNSPRAAARLTSSAAGVGSSGSQSYQGRQRHEAGCGSSRGAPGVSSGAQGGSAGRIPHGGARSTGRSAAHRVDSCAQRIAGVQGAGVQLPRPAEPLPDPVQGAACGAVGGQEPSKRGLCAGTTLHIYMYISTTLQINTYVTIKPSKYIPMSQFHPYNPPHIYIYIYHYNPPICAGLPVARSYQGVGIVHRGGRHGGAHCSGRGVYVDLCVLM